MPDQPTAEDLAPSGSACSRAAAMSDGETVEEKTLRPPLLIRDPQSPHQIDATEDMPDQATAEDLAPTGSACSRAASMSDGATVEEKMLQRPWVILDAVAVNPPSPAKGGATVDFVLDLYEPPRVSALTVSRRISSDSGTPGSLAYVVAVDPAGSFPLYATQRGAAPAYFVCDPHRGAASRLPDPPAGLPLRSFQSVGFISCGSGGGGPYMVADLQPADGTGSATLLRHWIGSEGWTVEEVRYSSESSARHPLHWSSSTVLSNDGRLYWIDISLGVVTCDAFVDCPMLRYVPLPECCDLQASAPHVDKRHCWVGVSAGRVSYLRIGGIPVHPTLDLWALTAELTWNHEYRAKFEDIWHSKAFKKIKRKIDDIAIALVHPNIPNVIYLKLSKKMYMVDLGARNTRSTSMEEGVIARPFSFFRAWELPSSLIMGIDSSITVSNYGSRRSIANLCWQGVNVGQIMASQLGASVSSVGSSLLYLNQECFDAKMFFKHMSEYEATGHGYAASAARKSAKASKSISKILGGAETVLSYGGKACNSVGFSLQKLHPEAQTGGTARKAMKEVITIESIQQAQGVIKEWQDSRDPIIVDISSHMETNLAEEILLLFKEGGAMELVKDATILREKATRQIDDGSDWDMV